MYLCYVDESGHCGTAYNPAQPVEVLCGVLTDFTKLSKTQREQRDILTILNDNGIPVAELKASDIYGQRGHWQGIPPQIRDAVFNILLGLIDDRACKLIVCPIDSGKFFTIKNSGCPISTRLGFPYEAGAVNVILALQRMHRSKQKNKGRTIFIFDEQVGHDENIVDLFEGDLSFTNGCTGYKTRPRAANQPRRMDQVVDIPHFSKSHLAIMIQLADVVAFIVARYIQIKSFGNRERYNGELVKIDLWYQRIGACTVKPQMIDPPGRNQICRYYRDIRPPQWTAKGWII